MSARRWISFSGLLLVAGALSMTLPGCGGGMGGGGATEKNSNGEVKIVRPTNPAPGDVGVENESSPDNPANKTPQP
jgi:hypothetical protein